ncbi:MAG TPA: glycosyltransferase family 39 protein [Frankiaceae bacterium]|nr:glycosyltransferase family 39 protein [Frankiaceae bacterium]
MAPGPERALGSARAEAGASMLTPVGNGSRAVPASAAAGTAAEPENGGSATPEPSPGVPFGHLPGSASNGAVAPVGTADRPDADAPPTAEPPLRAGEPKPPDRLARLLNRVPGSIRAWIPLVLVALTIGIGIVLRFATNSHLWLDEAITIEIARRSVPALFAALRHDGAPPLYYLLLHFWTAVFGGSDIAVRALSGVLSVATLPVAWVAGRRVARVAAAFGHVERSSTHRAGTAALLLFATSPYAIRYGSETRMYSLVVLLVLLFGLAVARALEQPRWGRWIPLTLATAALAYTHYWTFLLLSTVAVFLLLQSRRRVLYREPCRKALYAMLAASVLFVPWLPTFVFQMLHTGTPWAPKVQAQVLLDTIFDWAGHASTGAALGLVLLFAAFVGLTARPAGDGLHVDLTGRVPGRYLAAVWLVPLILAYSASQFGGGAYVERYTGISLPAFLLLASLGLGLLPNRRLVATLLVIVCVTGLIGGAGLARGERTQAGEIAGRIAAQARPGDVVAYCPDQLGPAVHRALARRRVASQVKEIAFADQLGPSMVDWVDYADRMKKASASDFATQVDELAGPDASIYYVRADGYRTLESTCASVSDQLASLRDRTFQVGRRQVVEGGTLERFSTR